MDKGMKDLRTLQRKINGREFELHFKPLAGPAWARNSVYVRGDRRDSYATCVVSGSGASMAVALRRAIRNWNKRNSK